MPWINKRYYSWSRDASGAWRCRFNVKMTSGWTRIELKAERIGKTWDWTAFRGARTIADGKSSTLRRAKYDGERLVEKMRKEGV